MISFVKRIVKYILAVLFYYSGLLTAWAVLKRIIAPKRAFTILLYHRVLDETDEERHYVQPGLFVSRPVFEKQISFLSRKYNLLSLKELAELLKNKQSPPPKSIAITFDDGWHDNYINAYPILNKYSVPATIFLTTNYIDTDNMFWFTEVSMILAKGKIASKKMVELLKRAKEYNTNISPPQHFGSEENESDIIDSDKVIEKLKQFDHKLVREIITELIEESGLSPEILRRKMHMLSWDEVLKMSRNKIDFGSHGCSHNILTNINMDDVKQELLESKISIEEKLSENITIFSYPNGSFNSKIKIMVEKAGYSCAVVTSARKRSIDEIDLFALERINVHQGISVNLTGKFSKSMFYLHIEGQF